jgi:hypothetical protein
VHRSDTSRYRDALVSASRAAAYEEHSSVTRPQSGDDDRRNEVLGSAGNQPPICVYAGKRDHGHCIRSVARILSMP